MLRCIMLTIVIPTLNGETTLATTLTALVPGAMSGLVCQLVIADGGSTDATLAIADAAGADIVNAERGRGRQLTAGSDAARGDWLLFLHDDTVLEQGWEREVHAFIDQAVTAGDLRRAAAFRFKLNDNSRPARLLEAIVGLRCRFLGLSYGDQGLLISRRFYEELGGFRPIPLMEDVDIMRRVGRRRLTLLDHKAVTNSRRYLRDGYVRRSLRNLICLTLYFLGVRPATLARIYG